MENKDISRRDFLKEAGAASLALGASALSGCASSSSNDVPAPRTKSDMPVSEGMVLRTNPGNGDKVSLLGYGCMRWPMVKGKDGKDVIDQQAVNTLVDKALAEGVNYFDSSPTYLQGQSEAATGRALARHPRKSYFIATKLSNFADSSREASIKMYQNSFVNFQTDYLDYYLLHSIGGGGLEAMKKRYVDNGILDFLMNEREKGKIRQLGFSFHGNQESFDQFVELYEQYHWDFVQIQMNYVDWNNADTARNVNASYLYELLDKKNLPIVVMEPLQGGRLSRLPRAVAQELKEREPDMSIPSWAFRFVGTYPRILTCLSGMTYMEHLVDNLSTFCHFKPLSQDELDFLESMASKIREFPTIDCNDCKYCMPCPYGIDIPGIFRHYNDLVNETKAPQVGQENYRKLRREYLLSYNRAIPTLRQADHCVGCSQCVPHCPQSIRIPQQLQRIDRYIEKLKQNPE